MVIVDVINMGFDISLNKLYSVSRELFLFVKFFNDQKGVPVKVYD